MTQTTVVAHPSGFFKKFSCLTAFIVALAELGAFFVQAASQDNPTNSYQANPANQPVPSQIQPTNQFTFKSAAEAEAQALAVSNWMEMARSKREEPQVQLRIHDAGATAEGGAHRLDLDGNLHVQHAVRIVMADQQEMEGHVVSLAASDASGQRVWLGQVKDCAGEQIPGTTQVIYRDAFDSIKADVILGYSLNSVEQFVVFRERFELPASIDPATARLEAWTEWFQAPEPRKKERQITLRQGNNQDDIVDVDEELDFGVMRMIEGKAFMSPSDSTQRDESANGSTNAANKEVEEPITVSKRWIEDQNRRFLVESVDYEAIKSLLDRLPARQSSVKPSLKSANPQVLPALTPVQSSRTAMLAQLTNPQSLLDSPGVVLDYELVYSALLNIQFGSSVARKIGGAAVCRMTNDYWNWYVYPGQWSAIMNGLLWSHEAGGAPSPINMTVMNAPGQWGNQTGDPMFDAYIYNYYMGQPITVGFSGIPAGAYNLYLYGHGAADNQNGKFQIYVGGTNSTIQQTAVTNCWNQPIGTNWVQGTHYVRYTNLVVGADGYLTVNVLVDNAGYPIINGLQLAAATMAGAPTISLIPNQTVLSGSTVGPINFTVADANTPPGNLTLSAASSNPSLIPNGNIVFGGSGSNRTVTITPAAGQLGTATLAVTVSDGSATASTTFTVTVFSLVARWILDESTGTQAADASGYGHTGTLAGNPTWTGSALRFDGPNDQVVVPNDAALNLTGDLTIAFWMRKTSEVADSQRLVGKGSSVNRNYGIWEEAGAGKRILFQQANNGTDVVSLMSSQGVERGIRTHVAVVVSGNQVSLYINGVVNGSASRTGAPSTSQDALTLGYSGFQGSFAGQMDDVRIYNGPLTLSQVATLAVTANTAPTVAVSATPVVFLPSQATCRGVVTDDGRPVPANISYQWTKESGPGTVNFGSATAALTTAGFTAAGEYILRLTANDGQLTGFDTIMITVSSGIAAGLDTDNDGMPNDWETANGFNPSYAGDASQDTDGDGRTNVQEYGLGTDPRNSNNMEVYTPMKKE